MTQSDLELLCWSYNREHRLKRVNLGALTDYRRVKRFVIDGLEDVQLLSSLSRIEKLVELQGYDVTGFSIMGWNQLVSSLALARRITQKSPTNIVLGGVYIGPEADHIVEKFPLVDYIVKGDAWRSFPRLLEAIQRRQRFDEIPGVVYRSGKQVKSTPLPRERIDEMPPPDYEGLPLSAYENIIRDCYKIGKRYLILRYLLGTGCVFRCNFCRRNVGTTLQFKLPTKVTHEIQLLSLHYGTNLFVLDCSEINPTPSYAQSLADALRETNVFWYSYAIPKNLSKTCLSSLYAAGCRMLRYGVESGSQQVLNRMNKPIRVEEAAGVLRDSHDAGIWNQVNFLIGYPYEKEPDTAATLSFIETNHEHIDDVRLHLFYPHSASDFFKKQVAMKVRVQKTETGGYQIHELEGLSWAKKKAFASKSIARVGKALVRHGIGFSGVSSNLVFSALMTLGDHNKTKDWLSQTHPYLFKNDSTHALRWHVYHHEEESARPFPEPWSSFYCRRPERQFLL